MAKRLLILEDGTIFEGAPFGADKDVTGEKLAGWQVIGASK